MRKDRFCMKKCKVYREHQEIAGDVRIADTFFSRFKGLLFDKGLAEGEGLLIRPCGQVHSIGMKFVIDVIFLTKSGEVVYTEKEMAPGAIGPNVRNCFQVLELQCGTIEKMGITAGQQITFYPVHND